MKWTNDRPTTSGWYWYRGKYDAAGRAVPPPPVVTHVSMEGSRSGYGDKEPFAWQPFMDYDSPLKDFTGKWAGPIDPPA